MRNKQGITIAALIIAIIGLSVGFAAFSNTLTISQSASVNPDASNLKVVFAKDYFTEQKTTLNQLDTTAVVPTKNQAATTANIGVTNATINNDAANGPTLTGLSAAFTAPGQSVTYSLYVVNAGKLKAYLTDIVFGTTGSPAQAISCTAATKDSNNQNLDPEEQATDSLVQAACAGISISVSIDNSTPMTTSGSLNNLELAVKGYKTLVITISYTGNNYVDGPMNVAFGDISINASSVGLQAPVQPQLTSLVPTDAEIAAASPDSQDVYRFAEVEGEEYGEIIIITYNSSANYVMLSANNLSYLYICDSTLANNMGINAYSWYSTSNYQTFTEYTGSSPISLSDFASGTVFSESYVTRVIDSFSNNNS